jgi:MFS family permease
LTARSSYPWLVVATVCVGAFLGQLDASIVSLVLPTLEETFHSDLSSVQWVAIVYLLVLTGLLTPLGRVADQLGRKALYTLGFLVFVGGSALCGLAPSLGLLIAARALQGIGAALLQANSVAIITAAVPRRMLGRAIGVQGTAQALGLAVGPTVGGLLLAWIGWRCIFLINLPIGLLGALMARITLPQTHAAHGRVAFNRVAALALPLSITALLLALTFFDMAIALLPAAALMLVIVLVSERRSDEPLIGGEVLGAPGLLLGITAGLLSYTVLFGALFAMPVLFERRFEIGPAHAGLLLTTIPALLAAMALAGGWLSDHVGPRVPTVTGMLVAAAGLAAVWLGADGHMPVVIAGLALLGIGAGLFIPANNATIMGAVPKARLGVGGGLLNMMRGVGTSLGVALVGLALAIVTHGASTAGASASSVTNGIRWTMLALCVAAAVTAALAAFQRGSPRYDSHANAELV